MGKKKKAGKDRLDKFYHLAKDQGYRSRAAFKLIQLNKKFNFLGKANVLIDLCAAPGSWLQVASKFMPVSRVIIGVDLDPMKPIPGVITMKQDITTGKCRSEIASHLKGTKADVVLHDGAPNVGTAWVQDAYAQTELTLSALKLAVEFLTSGGTFLTKVFRSADYNSLLWVFHQLFKKVTATKPPASRSTSAEIFVVCEEFLAPKKIDPRLLDPRSVFKEMDTPKDGTKLFSKKKSRRNREGYDTDSMILFKKCSVGRFIHSQEPIRLLAEHNAITFEPEEGDDKEQLEKYAQHIKTTEEIRHCLQDLKLLSARDFKMLLKWRTAMRKFADLDKNEEDEPKAPLVQLTEEQKQDLLQQEIEDNIKRQEKRKKKKLLEKQRKIQRFRLRQGLHANMEDDFENQSEDSLFNLRSIRRQTALEEIVGETTSDKISVEKNSEENGVDETIMEEGAKILEEIQNTVSEESESEIDSKEDPEERHDRKTEQYLDMMYNTYISANEEYRKKLSKRNRTRERKELAIPEDLTNFEKFSKIHEIEDELDFYDEPPDNELLVTPQDEASSKKASIWFDSNIFDDIEGENDDEEVINKMLQERQERLKKRKRESLHTSESLQTSDISEQTTKKRKVGEDDDTLTPDMNPKNTNTQVSQTIQDDDVGFEEVPIEEKADDYDYDDPDDYDEHQRAEMLVLGSILKEPAQRVQVVDKTINRYMYPDTGLKLPQWFKDDEEKHNKPLLPVTKEMVEEYKKQMKAIDARSTKKVAEAKARKKKKYVQKLEKARSKAKSIASSSELSEREKIKQIQKVYKGQLNKVKPSKVYVVGKKLGTKIPRGKNVRIKLVDPRLKKDKRGKKAAEKRQKKKRRTK